MNNFKNFNGWRVALLVCALSGLNACAYINRAPVGYTVEHPDPLVEPSYKPIFGFLPSRAVGRKAASPVVATPMSNNMPMGSATPVMPGDGASMAGPVLAEAAGDMAGGDWQEAANDLVARVLRDLGRPTQGVWLQPDSARIPEFESALRTAFLVHGVAVVNTPGDAPFEALYIAEDGLPGHKTVRLVISSGRKEAISENGAYATPGADSVTATPMVPPPPPAPVAMAAPLPMTPPETLPPPAPVATPDTMREPAMPAATAPPPPGLSVPPDESDAGSAAVAPLGLSTGQISSPPVEDDLATPPRDSTSYRGQ